MKKILFMCKTAIVSAVVMCGLTLNAQTFVEGGLTYEVITGTDVQVIRNAVPATYAGDIVIPAQVTDNAIDYDVVAIADSAFTNCTGVTSLVIPNSVTNVEFYAFYGCAGLKSVNFGEGLTTIGAFAFKNCIQLTTIVLPATMTTFSTDAFAGCSQITSVYIKSTTPPTPASGFLPGVPGATMIYIPCGTLATAYNVAPWNTITAQLAERDKPLILDCDATMGTVAIVTDNICVNDSAEISAIALTGYRFVKWSDDNTDAVREVKVPEEGLELTAEFVKIWRVEFLYAALEGTVINTEDEMVMPIDSSYDDNTEITVKAVHNTGYRFKEWTDDPAEEAERTITITSDLMLTVLFRAVDSFDVILSCDSTMGTVSANGRYEEGSQVTIEATPLSGYRFVRWDEDENTEAERQISVDSNITLTAIFRAVDSFDVVLTCDVAMGTVTGDGRYQEGDSATIIATPAAGFHFVKWSDNNADSLRTFEVTANVTLTAEFAENNAIISLDEAKVSIYPNPVQDNIHVVLPENATNATFTLYDLQGKVVLKQNINNQTAISVVGLTTGVYTYSVNINNNSQQGMLSIVK